MTLINALITTVFLSISTLAYNQTLLDLDGAVRVGQTGDESMEPGTIRFNPVTNDFEGYNGIFWTSLTGLQFETGEVTDADGNTYKTVIIGYYEVMLENLRTTTYHDMAASPIEFIGNDATGDMNWSTANYGAYTMYDTSGTNYPLFDSDKFGYLYNWYAVDDNRNICPTGWFVPDMMQWNSIFNTLGGEDVAGGNMKARGTVDMQTGYWVSPNTAATNDSGFSGFPGGHRGDSSAFYSLGSGGYWWSSSEVNGSEAKDIILIHDHEDVFVSTRDKRNGHSIRCVKPN